MSRSEPTEPADLDPADPAEAAEGAAEGAHLPDLAIITGMSGAGRSTAANVLEDLGWFVVDNLPPALLPTLAELGGRSRGDVARMAAVVDVRSRAFFADLTAALAQLADDGSDPRIVFLEASDDALVRRHEAVRRPHPLQGDGRLSRRHRPRARDAARPAGRGRHRARHDRPQRARARVQGDRGVRPGRARAARDGHVVRLQVRPAGRRRPGRRLPVPAQPALGPGAAAAQRPRRAGPRLRDGPGGCGRLPRHLRAAARHHRGRLPARGQALRDRRGRLHRRQAPRRSRWPRSWPAG